MKAPLQKSSPFVGPLAACVCLAILSTTLCVSAKASPPPYRGAPRSRIEIGLYSGPFYARDYRCGSPAPYYYAPPPYAYATPYYPPPPVYVVPPVYQGLPAAEPNYRLLAPSGSHLVAHVQEKLRSYGYYRGPIDGLSGAGTRTAIRSYQVDRGIEVTGRIDQELLSDLGL